MGVYRPSQARQQQGQTAPQEPNLVPIMNLFITIIPFLMLMIVISQVAMIALNFESSGVSGGSGEGAGGGSEALVEIRIYATEHETGLFPGFEIRDLDKSVIKLPKAGDAFDFASLQNNLVRLKEKYPDKSEIGVVVYPDVMYDILIRTIDICKQTGFVTVKYMNPKQMYYY
ncbi:MAG: biopolymer transporter ExbD [Candidatus Cloacimonetes bacterium]|mgnify:CR=1 FL=1|jgi:hypothetical protein|nr:biopolymer transporter ExbD [Candidatus Cloacimonadota bacterium]MDY0337050.1 biopolymer transporter ExbD [Candidatus Cloacimonadaceae bacterium]MCB5268820.1 biopolymer transporter ExbD [Candidatus Cloacimonadota bacterium]MDD2544221.1 biopolymer transporter ExbD [Candidatus Cloacimonadota bacterium]MDD2683232.1 biopolymer transporter ExbD [Candidatus Cloacimonadota bacterium]